MSKRKKLPGGNWAHFLKNIKMALNFSEIDKFQKWPKHILGYGFRCLRFKLGKIFQMEVSQIANEKLPCATV